MYWITHSKYTGANKSNVQTQNSNFPHTKDYGY